MSEQSARAGGGDGVAPTLVALVAAEGSATHSFLRSLAVLDSADATRNSADALHHLCMLHGRYPGVIDHAAARTPADPARRAMFALANDFGVERDRLARLVVAAGPIPSTAGQAETEASVIAQRHAIDMLAQSDRQGCAIGAAVALALDWMALHAMIEAAARRFGVETEVSRIGNVDRLVDLAFHAATTPAVERAMLFGAQQIATQHRGLWDLLEARAGARLHS